MAKQIFIQFTSDGAIVQQESSASNIRQGDAGGEVTIVAAFAGRSNADYVARAHFERPDGKHANVVMIPSHQTTNRFEYVIQSAWFFAVAGTAKVTITITDSGGAVSAQGLYAFEIAATTVDVIDSTLTYDEAAALEGLIAQQSEALQSAVAKLMNGETVVGKALRDADGNIISQTYAQDSRVVHLEGNERVYGTKEFVGTIKANSLIPHAGNSAIGDSEDGRWEIGYFKYVDIGYIKSGNLLLTLPNAGGVLVTETGAQSIANTAKEQAIAFANTYTDNQKNALQTEIDAINATQNVVDIVGTKANLLAYDTTNLQSDDKIEVLVDESQSNANTIYSWNGSAWVLVGSKAPYYSVAQIDALLAYYVTAIGLSTTLEDYATKAYLADAINENCITLDKGGYVNLAEDPASANTVYFGAHHGTKSSVALSDNRFTYKVSDDSTAIVHDANRSGGGLVMWSVIDATTSPSTLKQTKLPFRAGSHFLAFQEDLDAANAKISKQESDIQYLYRQVIGGGDLVTATDSRVSLTSQPFPLTVSPKALLDYVGGMCQKVNQLAEVNGTYTAYGLTATPNASNNTFTISGTSTYTSGDTNLYSTYKSKAVKQGHKYLVASNSDKWCLYAYGGISSTPQRASIVTANADGTASLSIRPIDNSYIAQGAVINDKFQGIFVDLYDLWPTDTPTSTSDARIQWLMSYLASHPEYDAGSIITVPVTKVVSKGFNIWDEEWKNGYYQYGVFRDGTGIACRNPVAVKPNTDYHINIGTASQTIWATIEQLDANGNYIDGTRTQNPSSGNFRTVANARYIVFYIQSAYGTTYNHDICINVSSSLNGTYMPYRAPIEYPIPAEVRALEGYGYGLSDTLYNYIDFERKMFVKKVARVDLGTLDWRTTPTGESGVYRMVATAPLDMKSNINNFTKPNFCCAKYDVVTPADTWVNFKVGITKNAGAGELIVYDASYNTQSSVQAFKEAMNGVYLYFQLATPVETDISEYIDSDVIVVSAGGHLEFENEDDLGVPYSTTYQCEPNP